VDLGDLTIFHKMDVGLGIEQYTTRSNDVLIIRGEEKGHCDVGVIHGGIPHGGACPPG
jgi:hypothetical protein